jgi:hypothetical protein
MSATSLSYSSDLTREEIIARYRDRIAAGKRSKLGKTELEQLILHFIDRLKNLDEASAIKRLCEAEIALSRSLLICSARQQLMNTRFYNIIWVTLSKVRRRVIISAIGLSMSRVAFWTLEAFS